jgi:DNA-binding ferritin-like protein (Dps family)
MQLETVLNYICENTTGYPDKKDEIWIPDNAWNITDESRQVKIKMSGMSNTRKWKEVENEYESLDKDVKKLIWRDHKRYMNSTACEAQSAADLGHIKGVFDSIKCLTNASQVSTVPVKTKDGKHITTSVGQLQRWREFLKKILNFALLMRKRK